VVICLLVCAVYVLLLLGVCGLCRAARVDEHAARLADRLLGDRDLFLSNRGDA
jgi:hypothetical protein